MKKLILLGVAISALAVTSCGTVNIKTPAQLAETGTQQDTIDLVPYLFGVDIGNYLWHAVDSTMNHKAIFKGIEDVFTKNKLEFDEATIREVIGKYMQVIKPAIEQEKRAVIAEANKIVSQEYLDEKAAVSGVLKSETGLLYQVHNAGISAPAVETDTIRINYTLYSMDGEVLDTNVGKNSPLVYVVGEGGYVPGFMEGVEILGAEGNATIYLPSDLAYGDNGAGDKIKPGDALQFDIEVVSISPKVEKKATPARRR